MSLRSPRCRAVAAATLGLFLAVAPLAATAATAATTPPVALIVTTPFPAVDTQPGSSVKLDVSVASPTTQAVELAIDGVPDGWSTTLRGGGFVVHAVTATPDTPGKASLDIDVPPEATPGRYPITVTGTAADGSTSVLEIAINVAEQVDNAVEVTADFPSLSGAPDSDFTFNLTIANNTPEQQTFTFDPQGPQGWTVTASPTAEARAATINIDAGATGDVKVTATPPDTAPEGDYQITVGVTAANGATGSIQLTAQVTGTPTLSLATADQRLDTSGHAGSEKRLPLIVANTGTAALEGVQLAGTAPTGWDVSFDPQEVDRVQPGDTRQVTAIIKPTADAVAGDYSMTIRASAGSQSSSVDVRFSVEGSRTLGFVAVGVIVVTIAALAGVFWRFGRR